MAINSGVNIVWLKRDLRLRDHAPLVQAASTGHPVLLIYLFEPMLMSDPHYSERHWRFVQQSLDDLNGQLAQFNTRVLVACGEACAVFDQLHRQYFIHAVFSYQEIGLASTFSRDKQLAAWFADKKIAWHESAFGAVLRGLQHRKHWVKHWQHRYNQPCDDIPLGSVHWFSSDQIARLRFCFFPTGALPPAAMHSRSQDMRTLLRCTTDKRVTALFTHLSL